MCQRQKSIGTFQIGSVSAFAQTLRRYTSLNHLAQAARAVLQNTSQINQMLTDLNRVDFANVQVKGNTWSIHKSVQLSHFWTPLWTMSSKSSHGRLFWCSYTQLSNECWTVVHNAILQGCRLIPSSRAYSSLKFLSIPLVLTLTQSLSVEAQSENSVALAVGR